MAKRTLWQEQNAGRSDAGPAEGAARSGSAVAEDHDGLLEDLRQHLSTNLPEEIDAYQTDAKARSRMAGHVRDFIAQKALVGFEGGAQIAEQLLQDLLGYGPLQPLVDDVRVTEIMVNGPEQVWVQTEGRILFLPHVRFRGDEHLLKIIERIFGGAHRRVDESMPMADAKLPGGGRANAVLPPITSHPTLTIRKFPRRFAPEDLVELGTLTPAAASFLRSAVEARLNIMVTGGTDSGKTTTLNALTDYIDSGDRIVTIEDAAELQLIQPNVVGMETRPPNVEGRGLITIRDLVRNALRMRPDRIIIGEVRGGEALDMLQAMNTGHDGGFATAHARSAVDAISRVETMALMAGTGLPLQAIRRQIASAIDLVVHQERLGDGRRRVVAISQIPGMQGDEVLVEDLFHLKIAGGYSGELRRELLPTDAALCTKITSRMRNRGIDAAREGAWPWR